MDFPMANKKMFMVTLPGLAPLPAPLHDCHNPAEMRDILPSLFTIADRIIHASNASSAEKGLAPTCSKGCSACCRQLVPVSEPEALVLADYVTNLSESRRSVIESRFDAIIAKLKSTVLFTHLTNYYLHDVSNRDRYFALQRDYFALQMPCPFLEDDACTAYEVRPLACRQYLVTSPPVHCNAPFEEQTPIVDLPLPADMGGALASFDGENVHPTRAMPFAFSLMRAPELAKQERFSGEPDLLFGRYLDLLSMYFSNDSLVR